MDKAKIEKKLKNFVSHVSHEYGKEIENKNSGNGIDKIYKST